VSGRSTVGADKRAFVPHMFAWAQVVAAVESGRCFVTCDDVSRVRVDALVPELIPRETHLILSSEDWASLRAQVMACPISCRSVSRVVWRVCRVR
jgi:hypothetical protein